MFYTTECGCRLNESEIFLSRVNQSHNKKYVKRYKCKKHKQLVLTKEVTCLDCPETIVVSIDKRISLRCPACKKVHEALMRNEKDKERRKQKKISKIKKVDCPLFENVCGLCIRPEAGCVVKA